MGVLYGWVTGEELCHVNVPEGVGGKEEEGGKGNRGRGGGGGREGRRKGDRRRGGGGGGREGKRKGEGRNGGQEEGVGVGGKEWSRVKAATQFTHLIGKFTIVGFFSMKKLFFVNR